MVQQWHVATMITRNKVYWKTKDKKINFRDKQLKMDSFIDIKNKYKIFINN